MAEPSPRRQTAERLLLLPVKGGSTPPAPVAALAPAGRRSLFWKGAARGRSPLRLLGLPREDRPDDELSDADVARDGAPAVTPLVAAQYLRDLRLRQFR